MCFNEYDQLCHLENIGGEKGEEHNDQGENQTNVLNPEKKSHNKSRQFGFDWHSHKDDK